MREATRERTGGASNARAQCSVRERNGTVLCAMRETTRERRGGVSE